VWCKFINGDAKHIIEEPNMKISNRKGFTLVELLVVIGIISILASLLLVGLQRARFSARMTSCKNNLRNFSLAIDAYKGNLKNYPDFLSNLYSTYIDTKETYICPGDRLSPKGSEGGKPNHEQPSTLQFEETDDNLNNATYAYLRNTEIQYCSYLYEFCGAPCSWASGMTWKEAKEKEIAEGSYTQDGTIVSVWGHVPLIRCFWHIKPDGISYVDEKMVINIAVEDRNIFMSGPGQDDWKTQN
jgi:prepilin-type N-terminal cleavage/methylation domain-containing protein